MRIIGKFSTNSLAVILACLMTPVVWAHPHHSGSGLSSGFVHPFQGWDHLLAMVAVGLLAVRVGGKGLWMMPVAFLAAMLAGGGMAAAGLPLPAVEHGILASVLVLGGLVAWSRSLPWISAGWIVACCALFHGHAHANEMLRGASFGEYAIGFLLATAILHLAGITAGLALSRWISVPALRFCGGAIAAASLLLLARMA